MNIVSRAETATESVARAALAGAESVAEKSEGQKVLERLLAVQQHMMIVDRQLANVREAIGVQASAQSGDGSPGSSNVTAFLPALRALADQMEVALGRIETHANEIAKAF